MAWLQLHWYTTTSSGGAHDNQSRLLNFADPFFRFSLPTNVLDGYFVNDRILIETCTADRRTSQNGTKEEKKQFKILYNAAIFSSIFSGISTGTKPNGYGENHVPTETLRAAFRLWTK